MSKLPDIPSAKDIADALSEPVRLKTWSLIVTVFGDVVMPYAGKIYAPDLNAILEEMGVNSGAVRTALSRLANDGIIIRERMGRSSIYRLAEKREREFADAALRIYANPDATRKQADFVLVACGNQTGEPPSDGAIRLSREWWLVDRTVSGEMICENFATFEGKFTQLPQWLVDRVASPTTSSAMRQMNEVFNPVLTSLERGGSLSPLKALAIRCLLIHAWRRIALRLRVLPEEFKPADWPEAESRALVTRLYGELTTKAEKRLAEVLRNADIQPTGRFQ